MRIVNSELGTGVTNGKGPSSNIHNSQFDISYSAARPFTVRPMEERDLGQAAEVEKDAFPTLFPPTSFRRELRNRLARYLVLSRRGESSGDEVDLPPLPDVTSESSNGPLLNRLVSGARDMWRGRNPSWQPGEDLIVGFVGLWYMVDEAHIVSIGVRREYRSYGLGELLLISAIEQALEMESRVVTLEVRVSNYVAQNLYKKYKFTERGTRKGYYSDNREDALIMTTEPIRTDSYREELEDLVASHEERWGPSPRQIS